MQDYNVKPTNGENISFTGEELGEVSSYRSTSKRWTDLIVYKTVGGNYVYVEIGYSTVPGEKTFISATVETQLKPVFGFGVLAKKLYDKLGISYTRTIL